MTAQAIAMVNVRSYLQRVDQLYADVRNWMAALEANTPFVETELELNEQATGTYQVKRLEIVRPGGPRLSLVPRGRYMVGAEGRVDVCSSLGREIFVWVRAGGPALGFKTVPGNGEALEELYGRPLFPGIAEGWAWVDEDRRELLHLDLNVFRDRVLPSIGNA
jgi:hypothetical protein